MPFALQYSRVVEAYTQQHLVAFNVYQAAVPPDCVLDSFLPYQPAHLDYSKLHMNDCFGHVIVQHLTSRSEVAHLVVHEYS